MAYNFLQTYKTNKQTILPELKVSLLVFYIIKTDIPSSDFLCFLGYNPINTVYPILHIN
jgi:hypothetical protein